ncbi:hypothetical protein EC973_002976 [Apophysomyces ossiformis]|uniref:Zn(2)-C6 fungal-type domain-containing protein n=1 Tax=Apophysomyces ossiformis TaxID=679940 RepID=A0A8H7BHN0_9FUNG|nr:hypothetical protein EC973_002976 [Apophysomyces ossiformis]
MEHESAPPTPESFDSQSAQRGGGIKRNKVIRACDDCRKKKVRCDGGQPCERCRKSLSECVYSKVTPKRGPPKQYVETLEPRLRTLERVLDMLELEETRDSFKHDPTVIKQSIPFQDMLHDWQHGSTDFIPNDPTPSASSSSSLISSSYQTVASAGTNPDGMAVSTTGQGHYVKDWVTRVDRISAGYDSSGCGLLSDVHPEYQPDLHSHPIATTVHMELIQMYFEHVHPYLPILHRNTFHQQLQTSPSVLLLNAMYAVASRWHTKTDSGDPVGWKFYQTAFMLLDMYSDVPRLSTVQALILLVKYHEHVRRPGYLSRTRLFFQLIVRMCNDLGLQKELPRGLQANLSELEQRRRTFWAVYAYDVMMSTEQGSQPHFNHEECTVDEPNLLPDEAQSEDQETVLHFGWMVRIARAQGAVLHFLRHKYAPSHPQPGIKEEEQFSILQEHLEVLGTRMKSFLRSPSICFASSFVHLAFYFVTILLHRPYGHEPYHRQICASSAAAITQIVDLLLRQGWQCLVYSLRGVQQVIHCLSGAMAVHLFSNALAYERSLAMMNHLLDKAPTVEFSKNSNSPADSPVKTECEPTTSSPSVSATAAAFVKTEDPSFCPSSSRSSPLLSSPKSGRPKSRRTSAASATGKKHHGRAMSQHYVGSDMAMMMSMGGNGDTVRSRYAYAHHRLSAPMLYQQAMNHSQSSSPISEELQYDPATMYSHLQTQHRRHTISGMQYPVVRPGPSNLYAMAMRNNQQQQHQQQHQQHHQQQQQHLQQQPNQQQQDQQQHHHQYIMDSMLMDASSIPMDPVLPDAPHDSMMRLLMDPPFNSNNPWDFAPQGYMVGLDEDIVKKSKEISERYNMTCLCPQVYISPTENTTDSLDLQASCMLQWRNQTSQSDERANMTASGLLRFHPERDQNQWKADLWMSRPYIAANSWFWQLINKTNTDNTSSMAVPGIQDVQTMVNIIPVTNQTNQSIDAFYLEASEGDERVHRMDDFEALYGRWPSMNESTFNETMTKIPNLGQDRREPDLVRLNDTCSQ